MFVITTSKKHQALKESNFDLKIEVKRLSKLKEIAVQDSELYKKWYEKNIKDSHELRREKDKALLQIEQMQQAMHKRGFIFDEKTGEVKRLRDERGRFVKSAELH